MSANVFCPTCGAKICEIEKSRDLKIKCKKCKSEVTIDKDETVRADEQNSENNEKKLKFVTRHRRSKSRESPDK